MTRENGALVEAAGASSQRLRGETAGLARAVSMFHIEQDGSFLQLSSPVPRAHH